MLLLLEISHGEYYGSLDNIFYNDVSCSSTYKTDEVQIADELLNWCCIQA